MKVGILNTSDNPDPAYKTDGSAGLDICASIDKKIILKSRERAIVSTYINFKHTWCCNFKAS